MLYSQLKKCLVIGLVLGNQACHEDAKDQSMFSSDLGVSHHLPDLGIDPLDMGDFLADAKIPMVDLYLSGGAEAQVGGIQNGGAEHGGVDLDLSIGGEIAGAHIDQDMEISIDLDQDTSMHSTLAFRSTYWRATHNSYEGHERGSILEQLRMGVRAIEYDIHDNDFMSQGYRLGHLQFGDAVALGNENPESISLQPWLAVVNTWSSQNPNHAPLILTLDLKDNLMDNRSYGEGNLAHLNDVLKQSLTHIWRPSDGLEDIDTARGHTLCILSGDAGTRRGYLYDIGSAPAISINSPGKVLEVHDSGSGSLWYWSGEVDSEDGVRWERHGYYDSGQRPSVLLTASGQVIEVHQSESRNRLWASTGTLSTAGDLNLESARDFSDGTWPSLKWQNEAQGLFTLRYIRNNTVYERDGVANFALSQLNWSSERLAVEGALIFNRKEIIYQDKTYRVADSEAPEIYPNGTLWLKVISSTERIEAPIRYEQLCFVEWQRSEYNDAVLGQQAFGAVPGSEYQNLSPEVRARYVIRGWQFSGRDRTMPIPQIPSTDQPYEDQYQALMEYLGALD